MRVLPLIIIILFCTSCQNNNDTNLQFDSSMKQIVFFSDESEIADLQIEAPYYDAIIELRQQFPNEFKNMKTLSPSKAKDHYDTFKVEECPALLVFHNEEVIVKIVGENTKEEIIEPITAALTN